MVNSFKSRLRGEPEPELKIDVGAYSWQVHSRKLTEVSRFFAKICNTEVQVRLLLIHLY